MDADHVAALLLGHDWDGVAQFTPQDAAGHLDVRAFGDEYVDISEYRVSVDVDLGGSALDLRQVDGHVSEECDSDQLILDVPGLRALAVPAPSMIGSRARSHRRRWPDLVRCISSGLPFTGLTWPAAWMIS